MANRQVLDNSQEIRDCLDSLNFVNSELSANTDNMDMTNPAAPEDIQLPQLNGENAESVSIIGQTGQPEERNAVGVITSRTAQSVINVTGGFSLALAHSSNDSWKKKSPGRALCSKVWDYFEYNESVDSSSCKVLSCGTKIKGKFTTNLKKHLKSCHATEHEQVIAADQQIKAKITTVAPNQKQLDSSGGLLSHKYDSEHPKQRRFVKQLILLFGSNPIPNNLITNKEFLKCFDIADPKLSCPGRNSLEQGINQLMLDVKVIIKTRIEMARRICLSSDIWTKKGMSGSYLGVLASFYDEKEQSKCNIVLSVRKFQEIRHTAENISNEMDLILEDYNIPQSKVWKAITDSGSNMVCAFRDQNHETTESGNEDDDENELQQDEVLDPPKYSRLSCFIHSLLLCLKKFDAKKIFDNLIAKMRTLVAKFSSSQVLTGELLKLTGLKLVSFCNTRWNIIFLVVQRLLLVKDSIIRVLEMYEKESYNFTENEWKLIGSVEKFLKPFNTFTDMSSTEGTKALSEVVMMIKQLKEHLNTFSSVRNFVGVSKDIKAEMTAKFGHFFSKAADKTFEGIYLASTFLDPRYRIGLNKTEVDLAKEYILSSNWETHIPQAEPGILGMAREMDVPTKKRKFGFLEGIPKSSLPSSGRDTELSGELELFHQNSAFDTEDDKLDPWVFWNQQKNIFPKLSSIALDILSVPLSIGHVERVFSFAGLATSGRRNRLDGVNLEREVFLNKNKHLMKFE